MSPQDLELELELLRTLVAVVDGGGFTRAAERLRTALRQPAQGASGWLRPSPAAQGGSVE